MIRRWAKASAARLVAGTGIGKIGAPLWGGWNGPAVLAYHRVVEDFNEGAKTSIPSLLVSLRMLEKHLDSVGRRFRWVTLDEVGQHLENGGDGNVAAITFDDGYRDFYDLAFPLLKRKGIPAAVFVVTDLVSIQRAQVHDKLYFLLAQRLKRQVPNFWGSVALPNIASLSPYQATRVLLETLPLEAVEYVIAILEKEASAAVPARGDFDLLTWEMLGRMQRAGITIGSHTKNHVVIPNEGRSRTREELAGSRREIEQRLGVPVRHFSYPSGIFDKATVRAVAAAGYRYAFTGCSHRDVQSPLLTIPRTVLWERSSLDARGAFSGSVLDCQMRHVFDWANQCRQPHAGGEVANAGH